MNKDKFRIIFTFGAGAILAAVVTCFLYQYFHLGILVSLGIFVPIYAGVVGFIMEAWLNV